MPASPSGLSLSDFLTKMFLLFFFHTHASHSAHLILTSMLSSYKCYVSDCADPFLATKQCIKSHSLVIFFPHKKIYKICTFLKIQFYQMFRRTLNLTKHQSPLLCPSVYAHAITRKGLNDFKRFGFWGASIKDVDTYRFFVSVLENGH
jgi:hypothetical protein